MTIAMVDQSLVNAHLDRIQRFVDGVNALRDRLNEMMGMNPSVAEPSYEQAYKETDVQQPMLTAFEETAAAPAVPVTADDIDLDAILSDISLPNEMGL